MKWKEIAVLTTGICLEPVAGIFHQLGSGGVVIEDPQAARQYVSRDHWNPESISCDVLGHDFIVIKAYFPDERQVMEELDDRLKEVERQFNSQCKVYVNEVNDEDWEQSWKKYYHTFKVGQRLVIKPSWESYQPSAGEVVINIDPGMAFGTGIHASTRFCLIFIEQYIKGGEAVVDAGCGSGILSIAAAKLGAAKVQAMDIDELAVRIARENIKLNGLEDIIEVEAGDILAALSNFSPQVILANITAEVVAHLIPVAAQVLPPGGWFFGSGIVDSRWPGVKKQLDNHGFEIEQLLTDVDWVGVAARKT
ncbi:MAG TPA: 50S ribosomal protein L11 methyltransferase [Syntrophomonadaceae bacterium]|nr:50S ribosomal protein L11 methyltransferase [Syntrophomonadaceae bacterium]HQA06746.1 50S ribosomal protein L11 methyltransferase [Syntrophomonadaceae bacterium]HQE22621.1 50S ribosomal protein L11 methyltransferase [Syntrophomonadaceae bacterium]